MVCHCIGLNLFCFGFNKSPNGCLFKKKKVSHFLYLKKRLFDYFGSKKIPHLVN